MVNVPAVSPLLYQERLAAGAKWISMESWSFMQ